MSENDCWNSVVFQLLPESRQRIGWRDVVGQTVPKLCCCDRKRSTADGWQFERRNPQTVRSMSPLFYLFTFAITCGIGNSSQQTPLQCLWRGQDCDKNVCIWRGTQQRGWQTNFLRKAAQSLVLISCSKSCGTQAQLRGGQAAADRAMPTLKKTLSFFFRSSRSLPCCGNFWRRSLARFMRAAQFASVSSCARRLLKHFRCKSLQIIWDTDDRWIPVSRDISLTVLWVCGLSSWLRTQSLTVSTFSSVRAQIDGKSK